MPCSPASLVLVCVSELALAPSIWLTTLVEEAKDTQTLLRRGRGAKKTGHTQVSQPKSSPFICPERSSSRFPFFGQEGGMASASRCFENLNRSSFKSASCLVSLPFGGGEAASSPGHLQVWWGRGSGELYGVSRLLERGCQEGRSC